MQAIGHNNPPSDAEIFAEQMRETYTALMDQVDLILKGKPKACTDDAYAQRLTGFIKKITICTKEVED